MDFDQLHTFLEIVRLKSFSKAAQTCYRTQPAISAQVRQLEKAALENRLKKLQSAAVAGPVPVAQLTDEIKTLRGRLAVDEAQPVPYTSEEGR